MELDKLVEKLGRIDYTKNEQKIYAYISQNYQQISNMSIEHIAKDVLCSESSIIRFCQKNGFQGFSEFKIAIKYHLEINKSQIEWKDEADLRAFSKKIKGERLYIFGKGASSVSAMYLFRQMIKLHLDVSLIVDPGLIEDIEGKHLIIVSNSGENRLSLDLIKSSNTIYAITKKGSRLDQMATVSITHNYNVNALDIIEREQQIYIIGLINDLINYMRRKDLNG